MSQIITLKLSDTDAAMLSELSEKEGRTPEELVLEAFHSYLLCRIDDKIISLSPDVCSEIIFEAEKNKEVLNRQQKLMDLKPVWES
ncbi:antitoxin [uncultured Parasutterella sp.]|uniref:antitoxin n=1 Tax=uncultured Parasutterella sp. TaxID=1263098 RepID=UPI0025E391A6|nr:antitoxin [uncultured Parasutterella sp.]